jgi:CBS domain-containing protein
MGMQVKDFMSTPIVTVQLETPLMDVRKIMEENEINALPVVVNVNNTKTIKGIITSSDFNRGIDDNATLEEIMVTANVHVVHIDSSAKAAAKMMVKHHVHHIVAMDEGKIVGMVSSLDFAKIVAEG